VTSNTSGLKQPLKCAPGRSHSYGSKLSSQAGSNAKTHGEERSRLLLSWRRLYGGEMVDKQQWLKKALDVNEIEETKRINRWIIPAIEWILSIVIALFFLAALMSFFATWFY
jgi:hypothetical protein